MCAYDVFNICPSRNNVLICSFPISIDTKKKIYHILYEDGDTDRLYELEVKEILAKDSGDKKLPAAKTIQECDEIGIGTKVSKSFFDEELGEIRPFDGSVVSFGECCVHI